jgi:hypothetical protein
MQSWGLQVIRRILVSALRVSALALSAGVSTAAYAGVAALDCPAREGALTRVAQAPDGRSCDYQGEAGETVRLKLVPLEGRSASEAMAPTKAELHALVPVYARSVPAVDSDQPGDRADIDLPFFHVHTVGDRTDVKMFGVKIRSEGENADVNVGHGHRRAVVHAGREGAEVSAEDVGRTNTSLVYVLAADKRAPSGYWTVGYVAKGPAAGPLVVGEFRATTKRHSHNAGDHGDIGRLIDRNVKG